MGIAYTTFGSMGIFFLLGVMLIVASLAPSRWKARTAAGAAPRRRAAARADGAAAHARRSGAHGRPQPPPAQSPSWQGAPQYGAPPAQPAASNPPPLPPASPTPPPAQEKKAEPSIDSEDDDGPGEWTRMYGGNRPK